ncbi:MAG: DUF5977 domain-containing protein [Candidatus Pseudobacter hemicellulosilyticus]|uniref:DUF5977 domain-containing protein n=1 Tax=Candidatus Pseudobacter hemicellulosilyticus TaxID=3121375 RepID=A0AAJ6BER9_9BACT|nr:MAG: DUF5977 domain-containing protein [Pseudobacter sp.]
MLTFPWLRTAGRLLFIFAALTISLHAAAQDASTINNKKVNIVSPEASSIALYSQYPIDYISGAPQIGIPLFTLETRAGTLPFSLSYHIGKIKPGELSGIVGFGWTLTPNIGITRGINGAKDGISTGFPANSYFQSNSSYQNDYNYLDAAAANTYDEQPDDFFYTLLSKSGQFIYNNSGGFTKIPVEPIVIRHDDDNQFTIIDDDGTQYNFGKYSYHSGAYAVENTQINQDAKSIVCWKVTEIIPFDHSDTIRFIYNTTAVKSDIPFYNTNIRIVEVPEQYDGLYGLQQPTRTYITRYGFGTNNMFGYDVLYPAYYSSFPPEGTEYRNQFDTYVDEMLGPLNSMVTLNSDKNSGFNDSDYGSPYTAEIHSNHSSEQLLLTEIRSAHGRVVFNYTDNRLVSLQLFDPSAILVKQVNLYQSQLQRQWDQPVLGYDNAGKNIRYCLDSVGISAGTTNYETYKLSYSGFTASSKRTFGVYSNYKTDFWGYAITGPLSEFPRIPIFVKNYRFPVELKGTMENPGAPYSGSLDQEDVNLVPTEGYAEQTNYSSSLPSGILSSIVYPTGGAADFTFESNMYEGSVSSEKVVFGGGYRIKSIKYKSNSGRDSVLKAYKYGVNETGVGKLRYKMYPTNFLSQQYVRTYTFPTGGTSNVEKITTVNTKPNLSLSYGNGAAVFYPEVHEYTLSFRDNSPMGKTIYQYNITPSNHTNFIALTPLQADYRDSWKEFSIKGVCQYEYRSGGFNLLSKKEYLYDEFTGESVRVAGTFKRYSSNYYAPATESSMIYQLWNTYYVNKFERLNYTITTGAVRIKEEADSIFTATGLITEKTSYEYDPVTFYKRRESKQNSTGANTISDFYYTQNSSDLEGLAESQPGLLLNMAAMNRLNMLIETRTYQGEKKLSTVRQELASFGGNIYPAAMLRSFQNNPLEKRMHIISYDKRGNLLEMQDENGIREVYLWGYKGKYPVAKIIGSDFTTVNALVDTAVLNTGDQAQVTTQLAALRTGFTNSKLTLVNTYTYQPLVGLLSETGPTGIAVYYDYDGFGRLQQVRDHDNNIVKRIEYRLNSRPESSLTIFGNDRKSQSFTMTSCLPGYTPSSVQYVVPANTYTSTISKEVANALADEDILRNGQQYANLNGTCIEPPIITLLGNNYQGEEGWQVELTNVATNVKYDFAIPPDVRGPIGEIKAGYYNIRIYNVNGNITPNGFGIGETVSLEGSGLEGIFTNVPFFGKIHPGDRIDITW